MDNWDEVRTAFQVARLGTVSGAAEALGVHHATVIRHIDALEGQLGVKLFQRHARGYTPTEAGLDLLRVAQTTDDQFQQMAGRMKGRGNEVRGELLITSLIIFAPLVSEIIAAFQVKYPDVIVRYLTGNRLFRLEYGEAHVALRSGPPPQQPDNVVQKFGEQIVGLYASQSYIDRFGMPKGIADFPNHRFIGHDNAKDSRSPFDRWLYNTVPEDRAVFRSEDWRVLEQGVRAGAGIGFMTELDAKRVPDLVQVIEPLPDWKAPLWLVTHVDLHRTAKVQAFLTFIKGYAHKHGLM